jgi:hypothetical protein
LVFCTKKDLATQYCSHARCYKRPKTVHNFDGPQCPLG